MTDKATISAFDRICNTMIGVIGDDCKEDLILVAGATGLTEAQIREEYPQLFKKGDEATIDTDSTDYPCDVDDDEDDDDLDEETIDEEPIR